MQNKKYNRFVIKLQLFADGGGTGNGGISGTGSTVETSVSDNSADAGQTTKRLIELGVPEDKIRRRANKYVARADNIAALQSAEQSKAEEKSTDNNTGSRDTVDGNDDGNDTQATTAEKGNTKRLTWDEIMADPEYNEQMNATVRARLAAGEDRRNADRKSAQALLDTIAPSVGILARKYGLDTDNMDYAALNKAICDDNAFYEDKALEMGVDVESAKMILQKEANDEAKRKSEERTLQEQKFREHIAGLERQGEELKKIFPSFDLSKELSNPVFARMTSPNIGISLMDAYYAIHRNEIQAASMQATAQIAAQKISNSIQSNQKRPNEAGTTGQAPSVTTFNYKNASKEQREAFKQRIRDAAARGEKIYPGM